MTHTPFVWFKIQKYMNKFKFDPLISYYSKGAFCGHVIECVVKGNFDRLKEIHERFKDL